MSRVCELTGKGPMSGNTISHANNKSRRRFLPNLNEVTMISDVLGQSFKFRVTAAALSSRNGRRSMLPPPVMRSARGLTSATPCRSKARPREPAKAVLP